jgi:predicted MPP superfamily phosphohydrolase
MPDRSIKDVWESIPSKYKMSFTILLITASTMIIYTLILAFSIQGMLGLYRWVLYTRIGVITLGILAIVLPLLLLLDVFIAGKRKRKIRVPSRILWIITLIALISPIGLQTWLRVNWATRYGDTAPQLIIMDGKGTNGLPNLAVVYYSKNPEIHNFSYGTGLLSYNIIDQEKTHNHVYVLENLSPNAEYWYKINNGNKTYFRTPRGTPNFLKFAYTSDPHIGGTFSNITATRNIVNLIADPTRNNEIFLCGGDVVDFGFSDIEWGKGIEELKNLTSRIPTRTAVGNHDAMFSGDKFYLDYYYPEALPLENGTQFYQRFDVNGVHFLVLDLEWGTEYYFGKQEKWLKAQLDDINATDPNGWIVVMSHTYYYASGTFSTGTPWYDNQETISTLIPIFEAYDVDLVLSGHIHDIQFLQMNNISYAIMGSFGGFLEPEPDTFSVAEKLYFNHKNYGFMEVEILGDYANITIFDDRANHLYNCTIWK